LLNRMQESTPPPRPLMSSEALESLMVRRDARAEVNACEAGARENHDYFSIFLDKTTRYGALSQEILISLPSGTVRRSPRRRPNFGRLSGF
jgi:hypothetical protein